MEHPWYVSMCGGNDTFEFLKDGKPLVTLNRTPLKALTWNSTVIRPGHFRLESYTLGEAGIEALSRTPGPESLGLLTTVMEHPWAYVADSAELAIEKMIGETWERSDRRRKIDEWLATHADSWIKPINKSSP